MMNRRDMLAAGLLGTVAPGTAAAASGGAVGAQEPSDVILREGFRALDTSIDEFKSTVDSGLRGNSMNAGGVALVKNELMRYLKQSGKFPEYCDVGVSIFFDVYDWHVRHQQQIQITRLADQRLQIQFMFTQLILRWENSETYVSQAYDR
jgi:hypothetical protein